ncbi:MAG: hypothetical protein HYY40_11685 [Bacteroidetes bacterium]|nr:hypothetical protein [Bacteroidota bacterium]
MIRAILNPQQSDISIHLPESYIGKKVEVIAFTSDEIADKRYEMDKPLTHFASEPYLSKYWSTPEEDKAWENL